MKKIFASLSLTLLLCACANSVKDIDAAKQPSDAAFLVIDVDITFDGKKNQNCGLGMNSFETSAGSDVAISDDRRLRIVRFPKGGNYSFNAFGCLENKILWTKNRRHVIEPALSFTVESGKITYPGTIVADWESEGFGILDAVINTGGGLTRDKGSFVMRLEDRSAAIQSMFQVNNPLWLYKFPFVVRAYDQNTNFVVPPAPVAAPAVAPVVPSVVP